MPAFVFHERYLDAVREVDPDTVAAAEARGRELTVEEAVALVMRPQPADTAEPEVVLAS